MLFHHAFFLFLLIIDLYFLIPAVITQIFNPTGELGIPTADEKEEIETPSAIVEAKISKFSI